MYFLNYVSALIISLDMTNNKTTFNFQEGDIVTITPDYRSSIKAFLSQPDFRVYEVMSINDDGTLKLDGVLTDIPFKYVEGVPLDSELTQQLYYDNIYMGRAYEVGNVRDFEDISARQPLMTTLNESLHNTSIWEAIQSGEFHYIHELQHWIEENVAHSRIRINQFWQ